ncbi:MAG TPA: Rap1a/Tai family immunity protein [Desulfobacterales bacterium]
MIRKRIRKPLRAGSAIILCLLVSMTAANAESLRGRTLLKMLSDASDSGLQANLDRARAMGYLQGMQESYLIISMLDPGAKIYCLPEQGLPSAHLRHVVVRWLRDHPDRLEEPAAVLVFHALADEYPCR